MICGCALTIGDKSVYIGNVELLGDEISTKRN